MRLPLTAVKMERTPLPIVKIEVPSHSTNSGSQKAEHNSSYTTGFDETDSDAVSEVDDKYSHAKVRAVDVTLDLTDCI